MTHIKICGIKEEVHALVAAEAGADFIGMVFAPSQRQVTPAQAEKIVSAVKKSGSTTGIAGVFVHTPVVMVNKLADFCHLDWVQLSGDESQEYCREIHKPIIKAIRAGSLKHISAILARWEKALHNQKHIYLLDSPGQGKYGGTGITFDWNLAQEVATRFPIIIAGGLTPENVAQAIKVAAPWGVDVSSGVETRGAKDMDKIGAFIAAVRRADEK